MDRQALRAGCLPRRRRAARTRTIRQSDYPTAPTDVASGPGAHPDSHFSEYITRGISDGFHISFDRRRGMALRSCRRNIPLAYEHPEVVSQYLPKECKTGHTLGPFLGAPIPGMHFSSFGVIPKRHQPGKWRHISDLSSPPGP